MKLILLIFLLCQSYKVFGVSNCLVLKRSAYKSTESINIVFVASGFKNDQAKFNETVKKAWEVMRGYEAFDEKIGNLSVSASQDFSGGSFCRFGTTVNRLLLCDNYKARSMANKCLSNRQNRVEVVIHNSDKHGGAGGEVPTATSSLWVGQIVVHELGHAIFGLGDEYNRKDAHPKIKNCTTSNRCEKWSDLIDNGLATCTPGCKDGKYYVGEASTVMNALHADKFGDVNLRESCCAYGYKTGRIPSYCRKYIDVGQGIHRYCGFTRAAGKRN